MKLVAIVGTNSDRSTNRLLLQFMKRHFAKQADIELLEIKELPAFQENDEHVGPQSVHEFSTKIKEADGVIISTPEYDHAIPAVLKSALEWISYTEQALKNKPVMITGASLGALGSSRAQAHLRQILDSPELKARIMPSSEFLLGRSGQAFAEDGQLLDSDKVVELEQVFAEFQQFVGLTNQLLATHTAEATKPYLWEEN